MEPVLRWPGAKWRIAPWIVSMFPRHEVYCEPFFGSGAIFFTKEPSGTETINDRDSEIINLFTVCREAPDELAKLVEMTPYSREEYFESYKKAEEPLERARRFLVRTWQSYGGKTYQSASWSHDRTNMVFRPKYWSVLPERILQVITRLRMAQIENMDARELIPMYNRKTTLLYVDPPYLRRTRTNKHYKCEFCTVKEHKQLLNLCLKHIGPYIISSYDDPLYEDALKGWEKFSKRVQVNCGGTAKEILWLNKQAIQEPSLFQNVNWSKNERDIC